MRNVDFSKIPNTQTLVEKTFEALKNLGGSGRIEEINNETYGILNLPADVLEIPHTGRDSCSELDYRLAWARTILKFYGALINPKRGLWAVEPKYADVDSVSGDEVYRYHREKAGMRSRNEPVATDKPAAVNGTQEDEPDNSEDQVTEKWKDRVYDILKNMDPYAFERLTKRLLRELGFDNVETTKSSHDDGIDGFATLKINGVISFKIAFQCKRYQNVVGPSMIRDFRGSLTANVEKGLFVTTGTYSQAAKNEAATLGKKQIDLMNGEEFIELLKDNSIGIREVTKCSTTYEIDENFFKTI